MHIYNVCEGGETSKEPYRFGRRSRNLLLAIIVFVSLYTSLVCCRELRQSAKPLTVFFGLKDSAVIIQAYDKLPRLFASQALTTCPPSKLKLVLSCLFNCVNSRNGRRLRDGPAAQSMKRFSFFISARVFTCPDGHHVISFPVNDPARTIIVCGAWSELEMKGMSSVGSDCCGNFDRLHGKSVVNESSLNMSIKTSIRYFRLTLNTEHYAVDRSCPRQWNLLLA